MASFGKVILCTFAGRRDRMRVLRRYALAAIERGLVDEWHVWDFARTPEDSAWVRELGGIVALTPWNENARYFPSGRELAVGERGALLEFNVSATNDVHVGLLRENGEGESYEIVLGGWGNGASVIRAFARKEDLLDAGARADDPTIFRHKQNPALPGETANTVRIEVRHEGFLVRLNRQELFRCAAQVGRGRFRVLHHSGYGADVYWHFGDRPDLPVRLFLPGPERGDAGPYCRFYRHYAEHADAYRNDILLKCDDDIVY